MKDLAALRAELYDTSYRRHRYAEEHIQPHQFTRSIRQTYFHAGRYAEGARDTNAILAWAQYVRKQES